MATLLPEPSLTEELLDLLLSAPTPEAVIALRPSPAAQERLRYQLNGNPSASLTDALSEADAQRLRAELERCLQLRAVRAPPQDPRP